jgi:D,D-heptose 1,7-bisphosphate phosphatase
VLVPIGGKPVLQHQLELASAAGIRHVTICAGHLADSIEAFVAASPAPGLDIRILVEREPKGTAGAVLDALQTFPSHFFVMYGDVMAAIDLRAMAAHHLACEADFTALVHPNDHPHDSDLVETGPGDWIVATHPRPRPAGVDYANLVNAALYVVRRDALASLGVSGGARDFVRDVMTPLVRAGRRVLAHRSAGYIKDMGTPERLRAVDEDWRRGRIGAGDVRSRAAVFLDRDGTLNAAKGHIRSAGELEILPGVPESLRLLREAGYLLVLLTNQPVIARGEATEADVAAVHRRLESEIGKHGAYLDRIYVCPHHPDSGFPGERVELKIACNCRKPATGLFEQATRDLNIDAGASWMIGDHPRDIEMARRAGLRSILLCTPGGEPGTAVSSAPDYEASTFEEAARMVLANSPVLAS